MTTRSPTANWSALVRLMAELRDAIARHRERLHASCAEYERREALDLVADATDLFGWSASDQRHAMRGVVDAATALPALHWMLRECDACPAITRARRRAMETTA